MLCERRRRLPNVIDCQTRIRQTNSSLYHTLDERIKVTRPDQICAYPSRPFPVRLRHQTWYNPYLLVPYTIGPNGSNKIDLNNNMTIVDNNNRESSVQSQQKSIESPLIEVKSETMSMMNMNEGQILPSNETAPSGRKRRMTMPRTQPSDSLVDAASAISLICQYCEQRFKNKTQLQTHANKCQYERDQR